MLDVIEYIRSFFVPIRNKRKRSTSDLIEEFISPSKHRKLSPCFPEDDWIIPRNQFITRGTEMDHKLTYKPSIIVLDDGSNSPISSTPNAASSLLKTKAELNTSGTSSYFTPRLASKDLFNVPSAVKKRGIAMSGSASDYAFQLDEKSKYQQLLLKAENHTSGTLAESFANYYTPLGKTPVSRGRQLVDLAKSLPGVVDLTGGKRNKTTTSETIRKVLDGMEEVVVVKDSDSDVEYLPTPPSPKPDFKVERINSLKLLASSCEPMRENWIGDKVRRHREELDKFTSELEARQNRLAEVRRINEEIMREQLEKQVEKCLHIKEVVIPIEVKVTLPTLNDKQEQMVEFALDKRAPPHVVIASKFNLNITRRDMLTLSGLNWLNDEVINFYMNLLIERGKLPHQPKTYAFNTFFYPKILKDGQSSVCRWTRKIDLFTYDVICVPIHLGMHWCMAIVDMRRKTVSYYDSMGKPNVQCTEAIFRYLQDEHAEKKGSPFDTKGWQLKCVRDVPQQMNGSDCGMFSCTYAEFATRNAPFNFSQEDMPYFRRKMVVELMIGELLIQ